MTIKDAIEEIAAQAQAVYDAEQARRKEAAFQEQRRLQSEQAARDLEQDAQADAWVHQSLPGEVRDATLRGVRQLRVNKCRARACQRAGLKVTSEYVSATSHDGASLGGFTAWFVTW